MVKILAPQGELVEGRHYKVVCEASGSRPKAEITWWKDGMLMTDATTQHQVHAGCFINFRPMLYYATRPL
ncbi:hypothetical protein E2C01_064658 [Portunus trituberculatus]|uniref:Ig-like domain-containing protein n=1 Tax=Portunus trituberculatus TaxID=210409 RepID=A0A5B7HKY6_PORTR|nr:hypothetical protein [Portunus trituberculatus]